MVEYLYAISVQIKPKLRAYEVSHISYESALLFVKCKPAFLCVVDGSRLETKTNSHQHHLCKIKSTRL